MTLTMAEDIIAAILLLTGALLNLIAAIGVVRLPDLLSRMHAATKPQVMGTILVVTGLAMRLREPGILGILVLVVLLQMASTVISGHMVGRAAFRARLTRADLLVVDELSDQQEHEEPRGAP